MRRRSENQILFDLGRRIAELREGAGQTQQVLADAVTLSPQRLREIESGSHNPSVRTLCRIAKGLDVELESLFVLPESRERRGPGRPKKTPTLASPRTPRTKARKA